MKIAYLGVKGLPAHSGAERTVEAIATRLASRHEITVYCSSWYTPSTATVQGIHLVRLPGLKGKYTHMASVDFLAACHAVLRGDYDLIHLHHIEAGFVLPLLRLKYPVVSTAHGFAYRREKWSPIARKLLFRMDRPFVKLSTVVTSVSAKDSVELQSRYRRQVFYIPNGVDLGAKLNAEKIRTFLTQNGLNSGEYLLFVTGRIEPTKGAHLAIEAVNRLKEDIPLLVILGEEGTQIPAYVRKLHQMAGMRIVFHSPIEDTSLLLGLMSNSRGLVFPSSVEAMSMVLLEAASSGVPVICSDIAENRDVMKEDALYFTSSNVEDLIARLDYALSHRQAMIDMGQQARRRVLAEFNWDVIAERYDELYMMYK